MKSLTEIQNEIIRCGKIINAPESYLKIGSGYDVVYNVEINGKEYHLVEVERGIERNRFITESSEEIVYYFIRNASHAIASDYELENRTPGQDFRRIMFKKQLELLGAIDQKWKNKRQKEIDAVLCKHPYDDSVH